MKFVSTGKKSQPVKMSEAVLAGLAPDGGLYVPEKIAPLPAEVLNSLASLSFHEVSALMAQRLLGSEIPVPDLHAIIEQAFSFPVPVTKLGDDLFLLELFHGPTAAFKDFGARFMAALLSYLRRESRSPLTILVATSGDTGGAVAAGFHNAPGIRVVVLYPSGRVSPLQEQQLTTWGGNVHALEVHGSFDDCQRMVKAAFLDREMNKRFELSSANSINLARLIPQSFYHGHAVCELSRMLGYTPHEICAVVPSGNFGNLTGAVLAARLGFPLNSFIAATNANATVPEYLSGAVYSPRRSVATLSNAMDVGDPSNFSRLLHLYSHDADAFRRSVIGVSVTDEETSETIKRYYDETGYILDPHTAVGVRAVERIRPQGMPVIVAATAHPAKFRDIVEPIVRAQVPVPESLRDCLNKAKVSTLVGATLEDLRIVLGELPWSDRIN